MALLEMEEVNSFYGKSHVLHDVSLAVEEGQLVTLIGRNGAGKTTTLKTIMGMVEPRSGSISFRNTDITGLPPHEVAQKAIAFIPEERRVFTQLTVEENLRMGYLGHDIDDVEDRLESKIFSYFPRLEERLGQRAGSLSGGEQQMLTTARALISDPDFLLVDEPTEGLMPTLVEALEEVLHRINEEEGKTVLLVEQNIEIALNISDYVYIIDEGEIKMEGSSEELLDDEEVTQQYLAI